ncbi:serine/threonine protein phosphatase [Paenibacillus albidus]|uniref:Serine/threonine protein phosphatase n=1 Tax=Paenibacillus albidus TaxID=2041023 RepID=A0A917C5F2_9BACL|nr:metallophosphoesterase family protein [Paenibacillus albidus]GGF71738.1 serine/threonine protein phosphatase [Paenibacillus albidus]
MDQIAIISDVHGNVTALQAVLDDIRERGITRIFCLGDIIGKGPGGDTAIDGVRTHCERVVQGNWDDFVSRESEFEAVKWHQQVAGEERLDYLSKLPFCIEFMMSGKFVRLFHASPRSLYERVQPWDELALRLSLFESSELCTEQREADIAGYGDVHNAFIQHLKGKTLFNAGSVGNPLDLTLASYVIMEGHYGETSTGPLNIQFVRVPYDIELEIQRAAVAEMPLLEPYMKELRTGQYRGLQK